MKALIYKEFKLAMHPMCYLFIVLFPFMVLIPIYPLGISFIYILTCYPVLFLGANKGQQSNDLLYSTLLPVRKKDIVLARIITVIFMQVLINQSMADAAAAARAAGQMAEDPVNAGLTLNSFVLVLAFAVLGYALADLIFFPIYYKHGKSIVMSTLFTIIGFVLYIGIFTIGLPYVPGCEILNNLHIGIQFACLGGTILLSALIHILVYKISSKRLEKVDF